MPPDPLLGTATAALRPRPRTRGGARGMKADMKRRRQVRIARAAGARGANTSTPAGVVARRGRRSNDSAPLAPSGSLAEVLKVQGQSTAALRAVKIPMAVEPSFVFTP